MTVTSPAPDEVAHYPAEMPRRILIVHPSAELYGSDRVVLESAQGMRGQGWDVHVALTASGPLVPRLEAIGCTVSRLEAPVLRKAYMSATGLLRLLLHALGALPRMLALLRRVDPDVVYVSTVTQPWWLAAARFGGHRVVCHVHEAEQDVPAVVRRGLTLPLLLANRVISNSRASERLVTGPMPPLRRRSQVVYNGVPGPTATTTPMPPRPARAVLGQPVRLVLIGRISPRKGSDVAVRALGILRARGIEATLDLVGDVFPGYEWFADDVRRVAQEAGVTDAVHWRGLLSDIWAPLAEADIALVPSRVEPFGNAAVEALLAERPLIATRTQGLVEIVVAGRNGELVSPGDPVELADAVERMVRDWPGARARAAQARGHAERRFAPGVYRAALVRLLAEQMPDRTGTAANAATAGSGSAEPESPMPHRVACVVGVFDLFHLGHLDQLLLAAQQYDELVVALPGDDLMESRTGERPFVPETERVEIIGAIRCVSRVFVLDSLDLTGVLARTGARAVLLPLEARLDGVAGDVLVPAGIELVELDPRRTTRSGAVLAALQRRVGSGVGSRGSSRSNVA